MNLTSISKKLKNFFWYCTLLKIKNKNGVLQPLHLREYQERFVRSVVDQDGPKRWLVLKPRQAGFSTIAAAMHFHRMATEKGYSCLAMADVYTRTTAIANIYSTYLQCLLPQLKPMVSVNNSERILFANPDERAEKRGLNSGVLFGTARDVNAGKSESRKGVHLTEAAFYRYLPAILESIQNSVPLLDDTMSIIESTANGMGGIGKTFYDLWKAAERGETIYKPFFVAWYEVDDYVANTRGFRATKEELEIIKRNPSVSDANLAWRRIKLREYIEGDPKELFKQDFPCNPDEAFRSTGRPVFDMEKLIDRKNILTNNIAPNIRDSLRIGGAVLTQFSEDLVIYSPPRDGCQYFIGADVAEGLEIGDSSSLFVMDENFRQAAKWHGKIHPDLFGHLLIDLGRYYNNALLVPESNNMGHTTVTTIRNENYSMLYKTVTEDKVTRERSIRYGWNTNQKSKMDMLNEGVKLFRDDVATILDRDLIDEMMLVVRSENGGVVLNGLDRVVAYLLACIGIRQYKLPIEITKRKSSEIYDLGPKKPQGDFFA